MTGVSLPELSSRSDDAFEPVRVTAGSALQKFLMRPSVQPEGARDARTELRHQLDEQFSSGEGVLVLTGLPTDADSARRIVVRVSRLLGEPLPQNREGSLIREVRDRGKTIGEGARGRYSDSRFGGQLHTDGAEAPLPAPDIFTLFCVRQSNTGGALQLVHVRDLVARLADQPGVLDLLRAPFHFDRRGDQEPGEAPTTKKPVLFTQNARPAITYLRGYIEHGHRQPGMPSLTAGQRAALDALDAVVDSGEVTRVGKQREGELAFFDNLSLLHGRTEFTDETDHTRLLLRTWISSRAEPTW